MAATAVEGVPSSGTRKGGGGVGEHGVSANEGENSECHRPCRLQVSSSASAAEGGGEAAAPSAHPGHGSGAGAAPQGRARPAHAR